MNSNGAGQTARMRRIVCAFVVHMQQCQVFLRIGQIIIRVTFDFGLTRSSCDQLFRFELSVSGKMELGYHMMHTSSVPRLSTFKLKYDVVYTSVY